MIGDGNKKLDVYINDQTTPPIQYYLMREDKTDITLTSAIVTGDDIINVSSGHGFTATGEFVAVFDNNRFMQCKVKAVNTNAISLQIPATHDFSEASVVVRGSIGMNVNGSITPQEFVFNLRRCIVPVDIDTYIIKIVHATEADDSKFGNITALANGVLFRKQNDLRQNLGNYQANSDFKEFGASVEYTSKAGGGAYGTSIVSDIRNTYGVVIRVRPNDNEILEAIVRDDLSSFSKLRISVLGQYTMGEL